MSSQDFAAHAEDPNDYNQRRRLKTLADAQERAHERLMLADAGISDHQSNPEQIAYAAVSAYAELLRWSIHKHGGGEYYNVKLGTIEVEPPAELLELIDPRSHGQSQAKIWGKSSVESKTVPVAGLFYSPEADVPEGSVAFVGLPPIVEETWTVKVDRRHQRQKEETFTNTTPVPSAISWSAFNACNKFLNDTELDVRISEGRPFNNYSE